MNPTRSLFVSPIAPAAKTWYHFIRENRDGRERRSRMPTLEWIGKDKVVNHHMEVPYRVLEQRYTYAMYS